jgi:gas vesicle protein
MAPASERIFAQINLLWSLPNRGRQRARLIRTIDAMTTTIRTLRERIEAMAETPSGLGVHDEPTRYEFDAIRTQIYNRGLLGSTGVGYLSRLLDGPKLSVDELVAHLTTLEQMLVARERHLVAVAGLPRTINYFQPLSPPQTEPQPGELPATAEAALLATVTEKFYGSAAFKALGIALVGAVLLAATGTVIIGNQSINLRSGLTDVAKSAEDQITKKQSDVQDQIEKQQKKSSELQENIDKQRNAYEQHVQDANNQIEQKLTLFLANSNQLAQTAVKTATDAVRGDLESKTSALVNDLKDAKSAQVSRLEVEGNRQVQALNKDFEALEKIKDTAASDVGTFAQAVARTKETMAQVELLKPLAAQAEVIHGKLSGLSDQQNSLAGALRDAQRDAARAAESASQAAASRSAVTAALSKVNRELGTDQGKLGEFRPILIQIKRELPAARQAITNVQTVARNFPDADTKRLIVEAEKSALDSAIRPQLETIRATTLEPARQAAADATSDARAAHTGASAVAQSLTDANKALGDIQRDVATAHTGAGAVAQTAADASKTLGDIQRDAGAAQNLLTKWSHPVNDGQDLEHQNQALLFRVKALEDQLVELKDPVPSSQGQLSPDAWKRIQAALTRAGFDTQGTDGKPGKNTIKAIRDYQHSLNQLETDELTAQQIRLLWNASASKPPEVAGQSQPVAK